eukprot:Gb_41355 [translate_table: standard]
MKSHRSSSSGGKQQFLLSEVVLVDNIPTSNPFSFFVLSNSTHSILLLLHNCSQSNHMAYSHKKGADPSVITLLKKEKSTSHDMAYMYWNAGQCNLVRELLFPSRSTLPNLVRERHDTPGAPDFHAVRERLKVVLDQAGTIVHEQLALARDNVGRRKGQVMWSIDNVSKEEQLIGSQLESLAELHKQLAMKKATLEEDHTADEGAIVVDIQTTPAPLGANTCEKTLEIATIEKAQASSGDMSLSLASQFLEPTGEVEILGTNKEEEVEAMPTREMSHLFDAAHVEEASSPTYPSRIEHVPEVVEPSMDLVEIHTMDLHGDPEVQSVLPASLPPVQDPPGSTRFDTSPLVQYESSLSETNDDEHFEVVHSIATVDTTMLLSTQKGKRSKRKIAPSLGSLPGCIPGGNIQEWLLELH